MKVVVVAPGSRGDVQPFVALGARLRAGGDEVCLVTHPRFRAVVERHDLQFSPLRGEPEAMFRDPATAGVAASGRNPLRYVRALRRALHHIIEGGMDDARQALDGTDVVLNGGLWAVPGYYVARSLGVRSVAAAVQPLGRTRTFPNVMLPVEHLPPIANLASHALVEQAVWRVFRGPITRWLQRQHAAAPPIAGPFREWHLSGYPRLFGFSPTVVPRPIDWPPSDHVTGAWLLPPERELPRRVEEFLGAGSRPIYVGFGSMAVEDAAAMTRIVLAAVRRVGARAILGTGWGGLRGDLTANDVLVVDDIPHGALFPRMAATVHHGGAGTTHTALASGVPTLAVPFGADQGFWGNRIAALGAGPPPIPQRRLTADGLTTALERMSRDQRMERAAATAGERINAERGLEQARDLLSAQFG